MSAPAASPQTTPPAGAERRRGYHRWKGKRSAPRWRWWVIARGNISLALANRWVKTILVVSLIPGVVLAGLTYVFLPLSAPALDGVLDSSLIFAFLIAALVGARLVSEDRRQGAFLAHFSRPVTRLDYIAGKFVALALPIFFVTVAPSLFAIAADAGVDSATYTERIRSVAEQTPDFTGGYLREASYASAIGAVLWFGLISSIATSGIVLGISALTTRARIAGVIWFAVVAFGTAAHGLLGEAMDQDWPALLSWMDNLGDSSSFLLGMRDSSETARPDMENVQDLQFDLLTRAGTMLAVSALGLLVVNEMLRRAEAGTR